jgi:hypothetical protein
VTPLYERGMSTSFKGMQICNCLIPMSSLLFAYGNGPFSCNRNYLRLLQVLLLALAFWSFNFTSICAFGLLAYVGYILYAFPSLFQMHRLNGSLLVFVLLWAASTYVFNVAFTFFNKRFQKDMKIWETVGLWHYSIPGLFLLAQFCLGVFVALCNLVNNSVFLCVQTVDGASSSDDHLIDEKEDTMVLIVATLAWGLRKLSRAITLTLLFLLVMKRGFIHAVYSMVKHSFSMLCF